MARQATGRNRNGNGANLEFGAMRFQTTDQIRGSMDTSEYKHVALGLMILKYISDDFEATHAMLSADELADPEGS